MNPRFPRELRKMAQQLGSEGLTLAWETSGFAVVVVVVAEVEHGAQAMGGQVLIKIKDLVS